MECCLKIYLCRQKLLVRTPSGCKSSSIGTKRFPWPCGIFGLTWKQCCAGWEGISAFGALREDDSFIKIYQPSDIVAQFHWLVLEKETTQKTMIRFWRRRVWGQSQVCKSLICKQWNWVKEFACNLCYANAGLHHPKVFGQKRLCIFRVSLGSLLSFVVLLPSTGHIVFLFLVEVPIMTEILSQLKCHA